MTHSLRISFFAACVFLCVCVRERNLNVLPLAEKPTARPSRIDSCSEATCAETTSRREIEPRPYTLPLPLTEREHPRIGNGARGSISIGTATDGYLVNQREMPLKGEFHEVLPKSVERKMYFGTDELVEAVLHAAAAVNKKYPGSIMRIGNISKGGGGDILWSASHNSGRDVDIAFYLIDSKGNQVLLDDYVELDSKGICDSPEGKLRFDVKRNWIVVKSLLNNPNISVQWIFISVPLKRMLIKHAEKIKEPKESIKRADLVLNQPLDSKPHNDHMHVRIYCSRDDILDGCKNSGSDRPWANHFEKAYQKRVKELASFLKSGDVDKVRNAIYVLGKLRATALKDKISRFIFHAEKQVRLVALQALFEIDQKEFAKQSVSLIKKEEDAKVISKAFDLLFKTAGEETARLVSPLLADTRRFIYEDEFYRDAFTVRQKAAELLGICDTKTGAHELNKAIGNFDEDEFPVALYALKKITNFCPEAACASEGNPFESKNEIAKAYRDWFAINGKKERDKWLIEGFASKGYTFKKIDRSAVPQLLTALKDKDYIAYNADKLLFRITKWRIPNQLFQPVEKYTFWYNWLKKNRLYAGAL